MSLEGPKQVPSRLLDYEKLYEEGWGKSPDEIDHLEKLEVIAADLKNSQPRFAEILQKVEEKGGSTRGWLLTEALSTYGLEFGLHVD